MATTNSSAKKPKMECNQNDEIEVLRRYILDCPHFSRNSENVAVKAALAGLDHEVKRRERDAKLQKKFANQTAEGTNCAANGTQNSNNEEDLLNEWQDVTGVGSSSSDVMTGNGSSHEDVEIIDSNMEDDSSFLGKQLAEAAIAAVAECQAKARSPLASIAVALHAAMRSDILGFACTGVPDEKKTGGGGFAAPIRELPKTQFLPRDWDKHAASSQENLSQHVVLRYRKNGTGSVLLRVQQRPGSAGTTSMEVSVKVLPATGSESEETAELVFPMDQHINMDSWNAACKGSFGIQPSLHYKGLSALMTSFATSFDLGAIRDDKQDASGFSPYVNNLPPPATGHQPTTGNRPSFSPPILAGAPHRPYDDRGPRIDTAFPQRPMVGGAFSGDLGFPGGGLDPLRIGGNPMGNLMGPNHPAFRGGGMTGVGDNSGFGMRPRFDPFGPPGGPTEIDPRNPTGNVPPGSRRPGGAGEPNPDHLVPPNALGNNMFS